MSILKFAGENKDFLKGIINRKVKTYDSSKNKINVAGMNLDGVVSATLSSQTEMQQEIGVDVQYNAMYESFSAMTLTVNLLPETYCYQKLKELQWLCEEHKAPFTLSVEENGAILESYSATIASFGDINMSKDASDKIVTFNVTQKYSVGTNIKTEYEGEKEVDVILTGNETN